MSDRLSRFTGFSPIKEFRNVTPSFILEAFNELVNDCNATLYQGAPGFVGSYPVGGLPTNYPPGSWAYAVDGCKVGEVANGTGVPTYYAGRAQGWRTFSSDAPVATGNPSLIVTELGVILATETGQEWHT
jgi:hypothetical protein